MLTPLFAKCCALQLPRQFGGVLPRMPGAHAAFGTRGVIATLVILVLGVGLYPWLVPSLPAREADFIRVVQDQGIWWFEDGAGHKFFSLGVNCIGGCYGHTEDVPMSPARKQRIVSLLRAWGFNTVGCWSSPSVWDAFYVTEQLYPGFTVTQHDVFDDAFWNSRVAKHLQQQIRPFVGMKNLLGYFLDNEPRWEAQEIFAMYLGLPHHTPGSGAFVTYLRQYYQENLDWLNAAWGTAYTSFDTIPESRLPAPFTVAPLPDIADAWRLEVAATFYRRYAALVRALDPHHLLLGLRYKGIPDRELFTTLSPYFDVNSINDYTRFGRLKPVYADLYKATGKPLMISEFSFSGFSPPGQQSFLFVDVYTQEQRGLGYAKYVRQAAQAPFLVGMHWFMWMDYAPRTGSPDSYPALPDENVGLVPQGETAVYEELVQWVMHTNAAVAMLHREARWEPPPMPRPQRFALPRFVPHLDGEISEWPSALALRPTVSNALRDHVQINHIYFLAWDADALYLAGNIDDASLIQPHPDRPWQADALSLQLRSTGAAKTQGVAGVTLVLYPTGGGVDRQHPYAAVVTRLKTQSPVSLHIARQLRPGGYTLEVRIPATALVDVQPLPGTSWHFTVRYHNVEALYQTHWEGLVTLVPEEGDGQREQGRTVPPEDWPP